MKTATEPKPRKVPSNALSTPIGAWEFAESEDPRRGHIKLVARSGEPIDHWWWGRVVHDFSGMRLYKDRCTLDYNHWQDEVLGYADRFDVSNGELAVEGELISLRDDDRANEVLQKGLAGVPWEASIKFDPHDKLRIEELADGVTAEVNGRTVTGPVTILREWTLRGIAICPYGTDPNTSSEFSGRATGEVDISVFTMEGDMSKDNSPEKTTDTPAENEVAGEMSRETDPQNDGAHRDAIRDELKKYVDEFGSEKGSEWYFAGKPLEECYRERMAEFQQQIEAAQSSSNEEVTKLKEKVTELTTRLEQIGKEGEKDPVSFTSGEAKEKDGDGGEAASQFNGRLSTGMAKFASGMKLRGES